MQKKILLPVICVLLFTSCVSRGITPKPDQAEIQKELIDNSVKNIENLLAVGNCLKAIQLILSVDNNQPEYNKVRLLYPTAFSDLKQKYRESLLKKDYAQAIIYRKSITALDKDETDFSQSLKDLEFQYVIDLFDKKEDAAAVSYFYDNLDFGDLSEENLGLLEDKLITAKIRGPLERLYNYYERHSISAKPETEKIITGKSSVKDIIRGTVTVWVNRGIMIQNGIGVPDRVIGSGFFIDNSGHILTNYHVISSEVDPEYEGFSRLYVKLSDDSDERIPAKVIGWDKELDIALLKVEIEPDYRFSLSRDFNPVPGDKIFAIGSPGGLKNTITSGSVSTLNRQLQSLGDSLQIDVPINPGNSGGPLLNNKQEVIGIVFAGIEQFEGINFAIPVSDVKTILPQLYKGGKVEHPYLGCGLYEHAGQLEVIYVTPGTPASQIGLKKGDILTSINGESFKKITEVQRYLLKCSTGELINVKWLHDRKSLSAVASLDIRPDYPMEQALSRDAFDNLLLPFFGMDIQRIGGSGNRNIKYNITDVLAGSTADDAGISTGDTLILRKWDVDEENKTLVIQIIMKTRKAGFIESAVQIGTYLVKGFFV